MNEATDEAEFDDREPVPIESVEQLVALTSLFAVQPFLYRAELTTSFDGRPDEPHTDIAFREGHLGSRLETIFTVTVTTREADIQVTISARWATDVPVIWTADLIAEFASQVGFMTVYPYLRQGVASQAAQLGVPIPQLPLMKRGDFKIAPAAIIDGLESTPMAEGASS